MTWPREGSRETDEGILISEPMDWCKSPTAIVPYKIWARQCEAMNLADSVHQSDDRSHVEGSIILNCHGDDPGIGGGVRSGTHNAECTPKTWSESVRMEHRHFVRHDDEWWMNHKNTWGRLHYLKDQSVAEDTPDRSIAPAMSRDSASLYEASDKGPAGRQYAQEVLPFEMPEILRGLPRAPGFEPPGDLEPIPVPGSPDPVPGPQEAPTGGGRSPGAGRGTTDDDAKDPSKGRDPHEDPKEGEGGKDPPPRPPPGGRVTGCRNQLICFTGKGDLGEYQRQLKMQQNAINRKPACKNVADIDKFDAISKAGQADAYRSTGDDQKKATIQNWRTANPGKSTSGLDALHELDMVAGGDPKSFGGMGDSSINQSIGPAWNRKSRKSTLYNYAKEMCAKNCRMAAILSICSIFPRGDNWA